jgi:hypothetical protein
MSHGFDIIEAGRELAEPDEAPYGHSGRPAVDRVPRKVNALGMIPRMLALVAAAFVITHSVMGPPTK